MSSDYEEKPVKISCPYCGEDIELLVDCSQSVQDYVEDCQVCCRPIQVHATVSGAGEPTLKASQEDEA